MRRRAVGSVGHGGGPGIVAEPCGLRLFPGLQGLQGGERHLAQERVVLQSAPGAPFDGPHRTCAMGTRVVELQLILELLTCLLAAPARFDCRGKLLKAGVCRVAGEVELALARGTVLASQPAFLARQVLRISGDRTISGAHALCCECSL